ncbi:hypothetical protein RB195_000641 [Necator americanus]|uniref:Uncharacterized protein n=1 Tax=Necator americanus TaxID=51031 RepID=A0ABR1DB88_NECAM
MVSVATVFETPAIVGESVVCLITGRVGQTVIAGVDSDWDLNTVWATSLAVQPRIIPDSCRVRFMRGS